MICASCGAELASVEGGSAPGKCPTCKGAVLLAERYRLLSVLGRGANGITYHGERVSDGMAFAIKEMPLRTLESAKAMELFEREARVLRQLNYFAIPRYEDDFIFGEGKNASLYLVQELVVGRTLADEMVDTRHDARTVFAIVAELAGILDYLHGRSPPVVHRDLKLKNVMRRKNGQLVLIDFGSVRDAMSVSGGSTVAGTFGYMAPEQLAGKATAASDVYGLGAVAVALLTRKDPDTLLGDDHAIDVRAHVQLGEAALQFLEKMLHPDPAMRPARSGDLQTGAREIAEDVGKRPAAQPVTSESDTERKQRERRERKKREKEEKNRRREEAVQATPQASSDAPRAPQPKPAQNDASDRVALANVSKSNTRKTILIVAGAMLIPAFVVLAVAHRSSTVTTGLAQTLVGAPELYARPIAVDVNGDGTEDMVVVAAIDRGPEPTDDVADTWGKENGHFDAFVQAVDGKDGRVLYAIRIGKAYTSLGNDAKTSERIVLVAQESRLGVARITATGKTKLTIHELSTGKEIKSLSFDPSSGRVCQNEGAAGVAGTFFFEHHNGDGSGTRVDLAHATTTAGAPASCRAVATPNVADVPATSLTNRTPWTTRFSQETKLRGGGPYGGRSLVQAGGQGVFIENATVAEKAPSGPTITIDNGGGAPSGRDNTKIQLVAYDVAGGAVRYARSLASLGFARHVVDHIEGTDKGALLFFTGTEGLAWIDVETGIKKWALELPKGSVLSSYTLSKTRAYLHVFGPDGAVWGYLSKKLASRILVVDLESGRYLRSLPEGPLEPEPPRATASVDLSSFKPVTGCACALTPAAPAGSRPDGGARDAGAAIRVQLGMYTSSSLETGGTKRFGVAYSFDVGGNAFALPHYREHREAISPPRTLEGDVSLAVACSGDTIVFANDRTVTAWSIAKQDELWTVEVPVSRGERKTTLGGGASLSCTFGHIDRMRVYLPNATGGGETVLMLADGRVVPGSDAGAPKPKY